MLFLFHSLTLPVFFSLNSLNVFFSLAPTSKFWYHNYVINPRQINRGYYMAARRYEISLRVLKNMNFFFQHDKRNFVSPSGHVMFYLLYKHKWTIPNHFTLIVFWCERSDLLWSKSNVDKFLRESSPSISLAITYTNSFFWLITSWRQLWFYCTKAKSILILNPDINPFLRTRYIKLLF